MVKTGGLADVTGALPSALAPLGVETTTLLPGYPTVMRMVHDATTERRFGDLFGGPAVALRATIAGLNLLVLDAPHLYGRAGNPYVGPDGAGWPDNDVRFAALGAAGAALAVQGGYDVLHAHDWQASLAVVYLAVHAGPRPGTVLTIHNIAFQGQFPATTFATLGLPPGLFSPSALEYWGDISFLKGGLQFADRITTVSPTYAREITHSDHGIGMDGVLRGRGAALSGILNGIDETVWNPADDTLIPSPFSNRLLPRRAGNKTALRERFGLEQDPAALLVGVISRMTEQKGLDLLLPQLRERAASGMQFAVIGAGDAALQRGFTDAAAALPGRIGCFIGYDEALAHLAQAGSDAILVPSRFEPCGLTQLCALRYGAVPIVARVGGLTDTVIDANEAALASGVATGIQFLPVNQSGLAEALDRAGRLWQDRSAWTRMQRNGLKADVSWRRSAQHYADLYRVLGAERS
jgi:starch synthase